MLPTIRLSVTAIHSQVPLVRVIRHEYETTVAGWRGNPLQGMATGTDRSALIRLGLLASQRSLTPSADSASWWSEPMPTRAFLRPTHHRLLRGLILGASWHPALGQFGIPAAELCDWTFDRGQDSFRSLAGEISKLKDSIRKWLCTELAAQRPGTTQHEVFDLAQGIIDRALPRDRSRRIGPDTVIYLDATGVRVDWFEVLGARHSARQDVEPDQYQQGHALFMAEQAFVRSSQRTPAEMKEGLRSLVEEARSVEADSRSPRQKNDLDHAEKVVSTRWNVRSDYLDALRAIGHADRMVMEYRLWSRRSGLPDQLDQDEPRDEMLGIGWIDNASGQAESPLGSLGDRHLPDGTRLATAAQSRRGNLSPVPNDVDEDLVERIRRATETDCPIEVYWAQMRALTVDIARQLADARGRRTADADPMLPVFDVVIAVGRGGALLATAMCQVLGVRLMGTMAMSRYADPTSQKGTAPYIRGVEFPLVNARRVLVCDDVIKSGNTIKIAIDEIQRNYPQAEIHVAAYIGHADTMSANAAPGGRDDRAAPQWYAGRSIDLRRAQSGTPAYLTFSWAPI